MTNLYQLEAAYHERVWGGQRLRAQPHGTPIGEAWVVAEGGRVAGTDRTVADFARDEGAAFLGSDVAARYGARFPLLIKLLDCADWLSVQVHPDDEQAARLVGEGAFGKTEAWHFLEVAPGARILAGVREGTSPAALADAIRSGTVLDVAQAVDVRAGDSVFIPAGTLHALGPGMLLYEVQQTSDTTYRVYDWDRPASAGRALHVEESVAVTDAAARAQVTPTPGDAPGVHTVVTCPYFTLDVLRVPAAGQSEDTRGRSFHALTVTSGEVEVRAHGETVTLRRLETVLVAGGAGAYTLRALDGTAEVLRAFVPTAC
ncbi:type I phosphomannose isomerase catalytic subunit [Deinococcus maricopensis]|uniref:Mannose-6-phosphate isomerase n=1 Tax=Deinococcus maricopensis (strain DSM 21211 / LMG 22137 / NRRL B-23946 / LB-34) TaxID=709986 RepID=E8UBH7_DEIML|nr:type I phosphomannose isomerase catalytic subunit [Deinococcus maricopensis]ADV68416.1 Mannose-6-phosphate isomerase [Deinococcus maricopensis DSM 21211]